MDDTPQFDHDCDLCVFLGRYILPIKLENTTYDKIPEYDLYYHPASESVSRHVLIIPDRHPDTLVIRSSNNPMDISASMDIAIAQNNSHDEFLHILPLAEAYRRAMNRGLIKRGE